MLDPFDYKEPSCSLCGGKEFYNPDQDSPIGTIPVKRIIEKLDGLFQKNDMVEAGRLLEYWQEEAISLKDRRGQLSITDELVGYYRKINDEKKGLLAVNNALKLIEELGLGNTVSGATIILNCATTKKAFGLSQEAIPLYDKTFEVYSKTLSKNDEKMAGFYNNKGLALADIKRFDDAEKCFNEAIKIGEKLSDGKNNIALTLVNMAHLFEQAKRDKKQIDECLLKAYFLLNDEEVKEDGYHAFACSKCAPSFEHFGYQKISDELNERAKRIYASNGDM